MALHGAKLDFFDAFADALNANFDFAVHLNGKSLRNRCELIQGSSIEKDREDARLSGVDGEITEADELRSMIRKKRKEDLMQKNKLWDEVRKREQRELCAGAPAVKNATMAGAVVFSDE